MNKASALTLFAAALALAGCAGSKAAREANPAPCPNILVLNDAARLIEFAGDESLENVAYSAEFVDVSLACRYYDEKPIDASVKIDLAFGRGPAAAANKKSFTYFVAVTRKDLEVITKREFTVDVEFDSKRPIRRVEEEIEEILIPRAGKATAGTNFEVIVGFSLTPEQVLYNRSGKSLKFPEL